MTVLLEAALIPFLQNKFPDARVVVGVGQHDLDWPLIVTVHANSAPIGRNVRGALWTTDFTVLCVDRSRAGEVAAEIISAVREGVSVGELPVAGVRTISLPELVAQDSASQAHAAVAFTLRFSGRYG